MIYNETLEKVLESLKQNVKLGLIWLKENYIKLNIDKCYLIVSSYKHRHVCAKIGIEKIFGNRDVNLLGININNKLKFNKDVLETCSKVGRKLSTLA